MEFLCRMHYIMTIPSYWTATLTWLFAEELCLVDLFRCLPKLSVPEMK